ncbi:MAG: hypothetical protein WCP91_00745 [Candidatus Berkelbacteria bacterium]
MIKVLEALFGLYILLLASAAWINAVPWAPRGGEVERRRKAATVVWWLLLVSSFLVGLGLAVSVVGLASSISELVAGVSAYMPGIPIVVLTIFCLSWLGRQVLRRFPFDDGSGIATFKIE